jgi:PQQ-dependent catabolism-associated CXXCW motif protein
MAVLLLAVPAIVHAGEPAAPEGYRLSDYRAPVARQVPGAVTVTTAELERLIAAGDIVLVDVLPQPPRPQGLAPGTRWLPPRHYSLPGAVWLPNTGYGALAPDQEAYFRDGLERVTGRRRDARIVFFCEPDCWMSWNATKRAVALGYTGAHFYPEGAAGWAAAGHALEPVDPLPATGG